MLSGKKYGIKNKKFCWFFLHRKYKSVIEKEEDRT